MKHNLNQIGVSVEVGPKGLDYALRKFKKKMERAEILEEYKARQVYLKPSDRKREKRKKAVRITIIED